MPTIRFNGGDDVYVPFTIEADGFPVDLSTGVLSIEVYSARTGNMLFAAPFEIDNEYPESGSPHGTVKLTEEQSGGLEDGRVSYLRATFVRADEDITVSTEPLYLERIL